MRFFALSLASVLLATTALATPADRFAPRAWTTTTATTTTDGGVRHSVVVDARTDLFSVRVPGAADKDAVASLVEQLLSKVRGVDTNIADAWQLGGAHGKSGDVAVMLQAPLSRQQVGALALLIEQTVGGHLWPAIGRGPIGDNGVPAGRAFINDRLVVTAAPGQLDAVLDAIAGKVAAKDVVRSRLPHTALIVVGAAAQHDAITAAELVKDVPGVLAAEPDLARELELLATVNDPLFQNQWHLGGPRLRQNGQPVPGSGEIFADDAWDTTKGDPDVVIAVFDSGTEWDHPDLIDNVNQDLMFDASAGDDDPSPECEQSQDGNGRSPQCPNNRPFRESHGTSVSGTIAARGDNDLGVSGVCPECSLAPVRLLGESTQNGLTIAEAFAKACDPDNDGTGQGSWIINNSWGPGFSLYFPLSRSEQDAFALCRTVGRGGKGTVILFATGNSTADVSRDAYAKHPFVIGVAASTNLDDWAAYSNYGREVDIAAPSLGGTVQQDNFGIICTDVSGNEGYSTNANEFDMDYNPGFSGTSAASPVAAGVAGLVLSVNPELTAEQVRLILTSSADKIRADKVNWLQIFGQDLEEVFAYNAEGHSIAFGYGRVNAAAAVALAADTTPLGSAGARCTTATVVADCGAGAVCSPENVCLTSCSAQSDCASGSVCEGGVCALPREAPTDFLALCSADCTYCVGTLDTRFQSAEVCTKECTIDQDCEPGCNGDPSCQVSSFDCRPATSDPDGVRICAVGDPNAGGPADFNACFNPQLFTSIQVQSREGKELCGDICFSDGPGSCPYGFHCAAVNCQCTRNSNFGCREFTCFEAQNGVGNFDFPICVPTEGHGDVCTRAEDCQAGDYCLDGRCRYDDRNGCDICTTCTTSADCSGRGVCIGTNNGSQPGVCATACDDGEACPGNSSCRTVTLVNGRRTQEVQACLDDAVPDFADATPQDYCGGFTCEVGCRSDVPCPTAGDVCTDGVCGPPPPPPPVVVPNDDFKLVGGGCGNCNAAGADVGVFAAALLLFVRRRRR